MCSKYIAIIVLIFCMNAIEAAEPIIDGSKIIVYDDGYCKNVIKAMEYDIGSDLKRRRIDIDHKKKRKPSLEDMRTALEKSVIAREPSVVVLMPSMHDFIDVKKCEVHDGYVLDPLGLVVHNMIEDLKQSDIQVYLVTPAVIGENIAEAPALNKALDDWATMMRTLARQHQLVCVDFRKVSKRYLSKHNLKHKERGLLTKDGYKLNAVGAQLLAQELQRALGLSKVRLGRRLTQQEQIRIYAPPEDRYRQNRLEIVALLDKRIKDMFPQVEGPVKPSCKLVTKIGPVDIDANQIINQRGTINLISVFDRVRNTNVAKLRPEFEQLFVSLKNEQVEDVYVVTAAMIDSADPDSKRNLFLTKLNQMIRDLAKDYEFGVIDVAELFEKEYAKNVEFFNKDRVERHRILMDIYSRELFELTGLGKEAGQ